MSIVKYRNTDKQWYYNPTTRRFANWLSTYMSGRQYKYSVYQQLFDMFSNETEQMDSALMRHLLNRFPQTFLLDTMDVVGTSQSLDFTELEYYDGSTWNSVSESLYDDPETWWYNSVPTRLTSLAINDKIYPIINTTLQKRYDKHLHLTTCSPLYVKIVSSTGVFINNNINEVTSPTRITIYGFDNNNLYVNEDFVFTYPTYIKSLTKWKYIDYIETEYYDDPSKFTLTIAPLVFDPDINFGDELIKDPVIQEEDLERNLHTVLWGYDGDYSLLSKYQMTATSSLDYFAGMTTNDLLNVYKLYFKNNSGTWSALSSVDSWLPSDNLSNLIYFVKDNYLLGYHKYQEYPSVVKDATQFKTPDPIVNLDVEVTQGLLTIKGIYTKLQTNKKISAFRFLIYKPDGTKLYCNSPDYKNTGAQNNNWISFNSDTLWTPYTVSDTIGFLTPTILYGGGTTSFDTDLIVRLDVKTTGGAIETDTYIVEKQVKYPIFQLPLPDLGEGITGPFYLSSDDRGNLCLNTSTKHIVLQFRNDTYIQDIANQRIVLAENYGTGNLRKTVGQTVTIIDEVPFNVVNSLDNYGGMLSLERYLGEKNYTYIQRLEQAMSCNRDASRDGMINGISTELGFLSTDVIEVNHRLPFILLIETNASSHAVDDGLVVQNLFDFPTIQDVYDWLHDDSGLDTTTILNSDMLGLPARCLKVINNVKYYYNLQYNKKTKIIPDMADYEFIYDCGIDGFMNGGHTNDPTDVIGLPPYSFVIVNNKYIVANNELTLSNVVWLETITNKMRLVASPVIVSSLHSGIDYHFVFENDQYKVSQYAQILISESDKLYPNKWSN